ERVAWRWRRGRRGQVDEFQIVEWVHLVLIRLAQRQFRRANGGGGAQGESIAAIPATLDVLESEISTLRTLHGRGVTPGSGGAGELIAAMASSCLWTSARRRSA